MKKIYQDVCFFLRQKQYVLLLSVAAVCSYGFMVSHPAIGIDDTAVPRYFQEGLEPAMGRWCLFLLNRLFHFSDFAPWMPEVAGVLLLCLSATLWSVLFYRILGDKVSIWGYAFFAAIFISCPLISELYVYYTHNGIDIGYGVVAMGILLLLQAVKKRNTLRKTVLYLILSAVAVTVAIGFYESLLIVYAVGVLFVYFLLRMEREAAGGSYRLHCGLWIAAVAATGILAVLMRAVILAVLQPMVNYVIPEGWGVAMRSVFENVGRSSLPDFFMVIKKFFVMYYLNGFCYLPVTVCACGIIFLVCYGFYQGIRRRDAVIVLDVLAVPVTPVFLALVEGYATHYRASQYVPLVGAFVTLLLFKAGKEKAAKLHHRVKKWFAAAGFLCAASLLWNQCADMNRWFYVDYLKYENFKEVMANVAYDLKRGGYDISKPIAFRGAYGVPYGIAEGAYLDFNTKRYRIIKKIADVIDPHLIEKFNAEDRAAYAFAETPVSSTLRWGIGAFDGTAAQLEAFWRMHGEENLYVERDLEKIAEAEAVKGDMPGYPEDGYILECEEYIIVNLQSF